MLLEKCIDSGEEDPEVAAKNQHEAELKQDTAEAASVAAPALEHVVHELRRMRLADKARERKFKQIAGELDALKAGLQSKLGADFVVAESSPTLAALSEEAK